jgi:pimeloyl-ACP methyl ester carboxylesterase
MNPRQTEPLSRPFAGGELRGTLSFQDEPGACAVLYVHGFGSRHDGEKARALEVACARRGWTYAAADFRGHGQSSGSLLDLRGSRLQEDLGQLLACLQEHGVRRVFPVGSSMGGWASAWFALAHPEEVPAVVGIAPALAFLERRWEGLSEEARRDWKRTGKLRVKNEWLDVEVGFGLMEEWADFAYPDLTRRWATPLAIFHGLRDDSVPYKDSLAFLEKTTCRDVELHLFKDGDHRLLPYKDDLAEAACNFIVRFWGKKS